jgi:uncharacterized protein YodC (DUF2158 family)
MAQLKAGMKVRHKSGGPLMIVEKLGNDFWDGRPRVWCEWFDAANYRHKETFVPEVLEEVQEPDPAGSPAAERSSQFFGRPG